MKESRTRSCSKQIKFMTSGFESLENSFCIYLKIKFIKLYFKTLFFIDSKNSKILYKIHKATKPNVNDVSRSVKKIKKFLMRIDFNLKEIFFSSRN